jgi:ketopantoate hydroxymethyltransferase
MAKVFGEAGQVILDGLKQYAQEVSDKTFPQPENWFTIKDGEYQELIDILDQ